MIEYTTINTPIGKIYVAAVKEGVVKISLSNDLPEELGYWCQKHLGAGVQEGSEYTQNAKQQILKYLEGESQSLNFSIIHLNTPFRKKVLQAERNIPYGETRSYGEVAKMVKNPRAARAVGSANAENPLALYFPCHRIITSDGKLGGYGGGLNIKQYLLDLEAQNK
ncbi:MAG: methylated-DNA--[protein]-cysteine S-methyltransferase [Candidatus Marinimicrobia bacterium]|nr:methylated-DNA--[protein]-cysteine S-methyltransferase [Candidatus Neomarinimicrobiota bacterium]